MKWKVYIFILIAYTQTVYGQEKAPSDFKLWKLTSYSGSVGVRGFYRVQERTRSGIVDQLDYPFLYGGFSLYTTSYIGHPQLLKLDIGGEYNPGMAKQTYTVSPDQSEVLTFKKLNLSATIFEGKPMSFRGYLNFSNDFINREYVTSLETETKEWGLNYDFRNKLIPISASYINREWKQREIETGRTFLNKQKDFQVSSRRSFTKLGDKNEVRFNRFEFFREDQNFVRILNIYDNLFVNNTIYFDRNKKYTLRSNITYLNQRGNLNQIRFQVFENIRVRLPYRFVFSGNYDYNNVNQFIQKYEQHRVSLGVEHRLFSSLQTTANYDVFVANHTAYKENNVRSGITFKYRKKIPVGTLFLMYNYRIHHQTVESNPLSVITITNEIHALTDGQIELLDKQHAILESIVVKDQTGSIIYQNNFDYIILDRGQGFYEVQRLPGGQIPNNGIVSIDYQARQVGSYSFNANAWTFTAKVILFKRFLELYVKITEQDYSNIESEELLTLNYYNQNIYGGKITIGPFMGGVEYDLFKSTIVPYEKTRYFVNLSGTVKKKLLLSLNGEVTDLTLTETDVNQLYSSVYGKVIYMITPKSKINLDLGYRKQRGESIDLDLVTAKLEYNVMYRKVLIKVGTEFYMRNYLNEDINFRGVYFRIDRRF